MLKESLQTTKRLMSEVAFMEGIETMDDFREKVKTCEFWADSWAIHLLEKLLKIKIIIFNSSNYEYGDEERVGEQHVFKVDVAGSYTVNNDEGEEESIEFTVSCQRVGKSGKGPRTARIIVDGNTFEYRFKNPHGGKYNKNWQDFYQKAAEAFAADYQGPNADAPNGIVFSIGKTEFTGELQ